MTPDLCRRPLAAPRLVRERGTNRPAVLLAWITDLHGRRLWGEVVRHTSFVRPEDLDTEEETHAAA